MTLDMPSTVRWNSTPPSALGSVWMDAGKSGERFLDIGAGALRNAVVEVGMKDLQLGLFEGAHRRIDQRFVMSSAHLATCRLVDPLPGLVNKS
jgi:hypothetical protein